MRDEEGGLGGAAVGVDRVLGEEALVDGHVGAGDGAVEGHGHHLRGLLHVDVGRARDHGAVGRAEAVGQNAVGQVASGGPVGAEYSGDRLHFTFLECLADNMTPLGIGITA